jgi:hypothetical protein
LPQAELTRNLLRSSRLNPQLAAWEHLYGTFNVNQTHLAPQGTRVIFHDKPAQRKYWDPHGLDGWYVGPALEHYRCYTVQIVKTEGLRVKDTVEFFPTDCRMPATSATDNANFAAKELIAALQNPTPTTPFAQLGME